MFRYLSRTFIALFCFLPWLALAGPIDINAASAQELAEALQGVGPQKAAAIIAYRDQHGPFRGAQDLAKVKGISEGLLHKNKGVIQYGSGVATAK